jgi:hypothetical protein
MSLDDMIFEHNVNKRNAAWADEANANAKLTNAKAETAEAEAEALKKRAEREAEDHFRNLLTDINFTGTTEEICCNMDKLYTMWIQEKKGDKERRKLMADKLDYGLTCLKPVDTGKASFYEKKINDELLKEKEIRKREIIGGIVVAVVCIVGIVILNAIGA